jgi:hypothetical protein
MEKLNAPPSIDRHVQERIGAALRETLARQAAGPLPRQFEPLMAALRRADRSRDPRTGER